MDEADDFVLAAFNEVVDIGKTTIQNAEGSDLMAMAGQSLIKEGSRAVRRLGLLCAKNAKRHGAAFMAKLKANEDIHHIRGRLMDLLWGFEDYVVPDGFEVDKFTELSILSKKSGIEILIIISRLQITAPKESSNPSSAKSPADFHSPLSPPGSPFVQPTTHAMPLSQLRSRAFYQPEELHSRFSRASTLGETHPYDHAPIEQSFKESMQAKSVDVRQISTASLTRELEKRPLPPLPPSNKTSPNPGRSPPYKQTRRDDMTYFDRPLSTHQDAESPVDPMFPQLPHPNKKTEPLPEAPFSLSSTNFSDDSKMRTQTTPRPQVTYSTFPARKEQTRMPITFPREQCVQRSPSTFATIPEPTSAHTVPLPRAPQTAPIRVPADNSTSLPQNGAPESYAIMKSQVSIPYKVHQRQPSSRGSEHAKLSDLDPEVYMSVGDQQSIDLPVSSLKDSDASSVRGTTEEARKFLLTPECSFYREKGFCPGANEALRGGKGIKKIKKLSGSLARCVSCANQCYYSDVERDMNRVSMGTYKKSGVNYRLRFLQKSHLMAKRSDDVTYGCLFCINEGKTPEESDATIFYSPATLMAHIARHSRPLPQIKGLAVVEQEEVPEELQWNYDIHLPEPPVIHPVRAHLSEVLQQPTGVAIEPVRKLHGQRVLMDKSPAHELALGSRLAGITWPTKYGGEWIFCWHDGQWASIPSDCVKINPPRAGSIRMDGTSQIQGKARWKWNPRDGKEWLKFDKGDMITNIAGRDSKQWFWSGSTSKGKWGIFPQDFLDPDSVRESEWGGQFERPVTSLSFEKPKLVLSHLRVKRASSRAGSVAESVSINSR